MSNPQPVPVTRPLWSRPAPYGRLAVRHDRPSSGWCAVDAELLREAARLDERTHGGRR